MAKKKKQIAVVDVDVATYVGDGKDGVYVQAAEGKDGWYVSTLVDSETGSFVDALVTDDGPYPSEGEAMVAGTNGAKDWCLDNDVRWDDDDYSLVNRIQNAIQSDDEDNSERIIAKYEAATPEQRAVVDDIFISLCGWSLDTLIKGKEQS